MRNKQRNDAIIFIYAVWLAVNTGIVEIINIIYLKALLQHPLLIPMS